MKNKETIIGWVLIVLLMIGFMFYQTNKAQEEAKNLKSKPKTEKSQAAGKATPLKTATAIDSSATVSVVSNDTAVAINADSLNLVKKYGAFAGASKGEEKLFVLQNDLQRITLSSKGGQIKSVELLKYKTWDGQPLVLFTDKTNSLSYTFFLEDLLRVNTRDFYFEPQGEAFVVSGDATKTFALRLNVGNGKYLEQKYTLKGNSYLLGYDLTLNGFNSILPENVRSIDCNWENSLRSLERNIDLERRYSALYFKKAGGDVDHLDEDKEDDELPPADSHEWISFKQQFFNTTLFAKNGTLDQPALKSHFKKTDPSFVKKYTAGFSLPFSQNEKNTYSFEFFIGPNSYNTLSELDRDAESIIKLGPNFWMFSWIQYITRFIIWVFSWFNSVHLNYGIIILLMTLILKIALHPLTAKSIESAAKMKILAPEIAALKEKYGDDQAKIGQEQMKLYNRAGVSPFGGCLPLLLQMPILMAMYYFFPASIELRQQPFLWATDLSSYDAIVTFQKSIWPIGDHISLFTILMTITSVGQAIMSNQMNSMANQQPGMKYMPYFMPVVLMFMFNDFPAALTYYYLLQNLLGMGHQWIIQKFFIDDAKLRKQIEEHKKNPKPASSWQKKIAEMQKQAEQRNRQKK